MNSSPRRTHIDSAQIDSADDEVTKEFDPVFINSRREAILITVVWLCAMLWSVPYCYINGYPVNFDSDTFQTVWGIPAWVFWGIGVPWVVANMLTIAFCVFVMKDDDLEPTGGLESTV